MTWLCPLPVFYLGTIEIMGVPTTAEMLVACGAPLVVSIDVAADPEDLDDQATSWGICCSAGHRLLIAGEAGMPNDLGALTGRIVGQLGTFAPRPPALCDRCRQPIGEGNDQPCTIEHDPPRHRRCCGHSAPVLAAHDRGDHLTAPLIGCPACAGRWPAA